MIFFANEKGKISLLVDMIPAIVNFAQTIIMEQYQPTIEVLVCVLGIIGDLCNIYRERMRGLVNQNNIKSIMNRILKSNPERYTDLIEWANNVIYIKIAIR
jgi:hypothetical protein